MRLTIDPFPNMPRILARVAPEISQTPYLVRQADLPGLPEPVETRAYAQRDPSPATRQALRDAGLWHGAGPVIVFAQPLSDRMEAFGMLLHELAHLLPFTPASDAVHTPVELATDRSAVAAWARIGNADTGLPRWAPHHDQQFIRVVSHLWYRALELCCLDVPKRYVLHWEYDLSPLADYVVALTPELRTTDTSTPFADIVAMPAPQPFLDLFDDDKNRWLRWSEARHE